MYKSRKQVKKGGRQKKTFKRPKRKQSNKRKLSNIQTRTLTPFNFEYKESIVKKNDKRPVVFGRFWMEGCGHCIAMEEAWNEVLNKIKVFLKMPHVQHIDVEASNADNGQNEIKKVGKNKENVPVNGYPTIYAVKGGNIHVYGGERVADKLFDWIKSIV
jgi:thiol-disulfide isomerase/thioredoxin